MKRCAPVQDGMHSSVYIHCRKQSERSICGIGPSSHALSEKPIQLNQLMYARASSFPAPHAT